LLEIEEKLVKLGFDPSPGGLQLPANPEDFFRAINDTGKLVDVDILQRHVVLQCAEDAEELNIRNAIDEPDVNPIVEATRHGFGDGVEGGVEKQPRAWNNRENCPTAMCRCP
jgi:hypothetical protein